MAVSGITLRSLMISIILGMGVLGIGLVLFADQIYRQQAYISKQNTVSDVIAHEVGRIQDNLIELQKNLAGRLVHEKEFLQAYQSADKQRLHDWLKQEFKRYFVTAGLLDLQSLTVYDEASNPLLSVSSAELGSSEVIVCQQHASISIKRPRAERVKYHAILCQQDGRLYSSLFVPVGGLKPIGYLQLTADTVFNLRKLEGLLRMPVRILTREKWELYRSQDWPDSLLGERYLIADYWLKDSSKQPVLDVQIANDLAQFNATLNQQRDLVIGAAILLTEVSLFF
ncbi:MAG: hypothetical protein KZQ58_02105 [gamma proteobacterium symbiont of Bathyaustriella thionipta]|nr:hypothetical protein [gamma proteobacterium symbiont of Bathyaustriella thionipta]